VPLVLSLTHARALFPVALRELQDPSRQRYEREFRFLEKVNGIIFVADSQDALAERNVAFLERTRSDLLELGRESRDVPVVFQLNKRDLLNLRPVATLKDDLKWPCCDYLESVATTEVGIAAALDHLLDLLG
jgi:hypothetical protein